MTIYLIVHEDTRETLAAFSTLDLANTYRSTYNAAGVFGGAVTIRKIEVSK